MTEVIHKLYFDAANYQYYNMYTHQYNERSLRHLLLVKPLSKVMYKWLSRKIGRLVCYYFNAGDKND